MAEELKRLGETLRSKRKELNLSLKEVENATSIRSSYLEAIEDGSITHLIAGIYAQGFLKQYASFLGMEVDQLVRDNPMAFRMPGEKHEFAYGIGTLEVRGSQGGGVKWFPNLLWAGLSAVVLVIAWYVAKALGIL
ncbi:MAG: helix-turn-helix domain-containing protein [Verrucomicrobia bacterium]|nr:helix-turn-helix domain-containing protein [Verrucomicrobiota bacterium]